MNKRTDLARLLRELADYLDSRTDDDLAPLFEAAREIRKRSEPSSKRPTKPDLEVLHRDLVALRTREEGLALLESRLRVRGELESLARYLSLPVQRDDTVERLKAKIIESVIGARLRSDAIQGASIGSRKD